MPGFLGGSTGGATSGAGGEITFPKEFVDPVTKLRVSNPQNLIDTDFEYGLQPTKWETVELINNTPSFFSKSGDTTIPNIVSITTNAGTREIIVTTALAHGLAVGIPINVTGTKALTADGSYIINSIPDPTTFTYLCRDTQPTTASIEDLYSSIITGEFFQGSQLNIAPAEGIISDGEAISTLTVTTESTHGFGVKTPFYFLNLNSTISQEFAAANTESKAFDSSNSATAQTFDGSNTLSSINIDWTNSAVVGGVQSTIDSVNLVDNTITVAHGAENFVGLLVGQPLYYDVTAGAGYFLANPRGVIFLVENGTLGVGQSTFQVSSVPNGTPLTIGSNLSGTFQIANQARTFAGNNINLSTEVSVDVFRDDAKTFDATNTTGLTGTQTGYSGSNVTVTSVDELPWYFGAMVFYSTTGAAASGLTNNTTYFINDFFRQGLTDNYSFTLSPLPGEPIITSISGGTGTQTFTQIFMSIDKDVFHVFNHGYQEGDMLEYEYPTGGQFEVETVDEEVNFYFVKDRYDVHNFTVSQTTGDIIPAAISYVGIDRGTTITPTTVETVGLEAPIAFSISSGTLPNGLSFDTGTGIVSGTIVEAIDPAREVVIKALDVEEAEAFQTLTFQINATTGVINPETLSREGTDAGSPITPITFTTENLVAPITWDVFSGTLPSGLSLNTSTGEITGTPEAAYPTAQVVIRATDVGDLEAFSTITFQYNEVPELYAFTNATFTTGGRTGRSGPSITQARSGVGNPSWAADYLNMTINGVQDWTVPTDATYRIEAAGARGGGNSGLGGRLRVDVVLQKETVLRLVVGQTGTNGGGAGDGGGGGSFVFTGTPGGTGLILAAAGGGGDDDGGTNGRTARSDLRPIDDRGSVRNNDGRNGQLGYEDGQGWLGSIAAENFEGERYVRNNPSTRRGGQGGFGGGGDSYDDGGGSGGFTGGGGSTSAGGGAGGSYYAGFNGTGFTASYTSIWESATSNYSWLGTNSSTNGYITITKL